MRQIDLSRTLPQARIPELPNPYFGKVRDCYDLPDGTRLLISSDRISAFDQILAVIPWKGQVLTQLARYWFDHTGDIAANHVLGYPDPNTVHCKRVTILPVEIVVRGYLAGTTSTSILTQYKAGARTMYGHTLPDGLRDNEALPQAIITPTSKAFDGGHDEPLTAAEILAVRPVNPGPMGRSQRQGARPFRPRAGNGGKTRAYPCGHQIRVRHGCRGQHPPRRRNPHPRFQPLLDRRRL
jgi:phosphoribosylaminoimidazole-succinocarboxamide synthase